MSLLLTFNVLHTSSSISIVKFEKVNRRALDSQSKHKNETRNMKMEFEENSRLTNDQLSRAHEMIENQALEITKYVIQLEEFEETISGSHITIVD